MDYTVVNPMESITMRGPSWQLLGDMAVHQLKEGHTKFAIALIPFMVDKLNEFVKYADEDGKISVSTPRKEASNAKN